MTGIETNFNYQFFTEVRISRLETVEVPHPDKTNLFGTRKDSWSCHKPSHKFGSMHKWFPKDSLFYLTKERSVSYPIGYRFRNSLVGTHSDFSFLFHSWTNLSIFFYYRSKPTDHHDLHNGTLYTINLQSPLYKVLPYERHQFPRIYKCVIFLINYKKFDSLIFLYLRSKGFSFYSW